MKINVQNPSVLEDFPTSSLITSKTGFITGFLAHSQSARLTSHGKNSNMADIYIAQNEPLVVSQESINALHVIINDNDCSDTFIQQICQHLDEKGIVYQFTTYGQGINVSDSVVVTLDQQYISGPNMVILAPYDNNRIGNSDALALAFRAAFDEKGFPIDGVYCGKKGYKQSVNSNTVLTRIPTSTEDGIAKDKNTSFVTVCFGTENTNPIYAADAIENALGRFASYVQCPSDADLIYCAGEEDTLAELAERYHTSISTINITSGMPYDNCTLTSNQAIINPCTMQVKEFDSNLPVEIAVKKGSIKTN